LAGGEEEQRWGFVMREVQENDLGECAMALSQMVECEPDVTRIQQILRVARSKLGAAMEQLEQYELSPDALEQVQCSAAGVACEIDSLLTTVKCECS
jgi:hypothetical protein